MKREDGISMRIPEGWIDHNLKALKKKAFFCHERIINEMKDPTQFIQVRCREPVLVVPLSELEGLEKDLREMLENADNPHLQVEGEDPVYVDTVEAVRAIKQAVIKMEKTLLKGILGE